MSTSCLACCVLVCLFGEVSCLNKWPDSDNHFSWELGTRYYIVPDVYAQLLLPNGFKLSIPDNPYVEKVTFHVNIDRRFTPEEHGYLFPITQPITRPKRKLFRRDSRGRYVFVGYIPPNDSFTFSNWHKRRRRRYGRWAGYPSQEMNMAKGAIYPGQFVHVAKDVDVHGKWSYVNRLVLLRVNQTVHFYIIVKCADKKVRSRLDQYFIVGKRYNGSLCIRKRNRFISIHGFGF